jgi:hypothetical protein
MRDLGRGREHGMLSAKGVSLKKKNSGEIENKISFIQKD